MKVVCIDDKPSPRGFGPCLLKFGEIYTVIGEAMGFGSDGSIELCYRLEEIDCYVYEKPRFAPTSDIDETTFVRDNISEPA